MSSALIGLGSNLGDRIQYLRRACEQLGTHPAVRIAATSPLYETPPIGPPQGTFLNAVIRVETSLSPYGLLRLCQAVERAGKRKRTIHWGPRT
ncbi:MAG TPA: 2-amino-4-hydroxy-6-hydroxymethyldihydropteridine diphosphokinase, partial [Firmicutes bacterium]|nr:2-amino-4-hydroxy-6-hydroxymethyldihydropteridine diphosphokinase [Bacillota bacterium]